MSTEIYRATIALNGSLSNAIALSGAWLVQIDIPAGWTAAVLTFQSSPDGETYSDLYDTSNTEISLTVSAGKARRVDPNLFMGIPYIKLRSGTSGSPVNQLTSAKILTLTTVNE